MVTGTINIEKQEHEHAGTRDGLCTAESENDETAKIPPGATDYPVLHVLVSNQASKTFTKRRRCALVPRATSGWRQENAPDYEYDFWAV